MEELNRSLSTTVSGYYYVRVQNKKTKTVDISNLLSYFDFQGDNRKITFLCSLSTDTEIFASRKHQCRLDQDGTKMKDCKAIFSEEFWSLPSVLPYVYGTHSTLEITICFY